MIRGPLISVAALQKLIATSTRPVHLLDASWHLPVTNRLADKEFLAEHLPGARFFDVMKIVDPSSILPHAFPPPTVFAEALGKFGIRPGDETIIYETGDILAAPRTWFTFHMLGHTEVTLLDGGMRAWKAAGGATEAGEPAPCETVPYDPALLRMPKMISTEEVLKNIETDEFQLVDGRSNRRFIALDPEPRDDCPRGHVPSAINIPFTDFCNPDAPEFFAPPHECERVLNQVTRPTVSMCGSGMTACVSIMAAYMLGRPLPLLYEGSWVEWVMDPERPRTVLTPESEQLHE